MRSPNRIYPFIAKLASCWYDHPDLRFGQLVQVVLGSDPFYMEDDEALRKFEEFEAKEDRQ